ILLHFLKIYSSGPLSSKANDLTRQQQSKQVGWLMNKPKKQFLGCVAKHTPPEISTQTAQSEYRARERLQMFCRGLPNRTQESYSLSNYS
ncbi:hypothetical protein PROFUN_16281, partial [Planoprotostelium fungivorum]